MPRRSSTSGAAGAGWPSASRSRAASAWVTAESTISSASEAPGICTRSSTTPNARCNRPVAVSTPWTRAIGTIFSSGVKTPER